MPDGSGPPQSPLLVDRHGCPRAAFAGPGMGCGKGRRPCRSDARRASDKRRRGRWPHRGRSRSCRSDAPWASGTGDYCSGRCGWMLLRLSASCWRASRPRLLRPRPLRWQGWGAGPSGLASGKLGCGAASTGGLTRWGLVLRPPRGAGRLVLPRASSLPAGSLPLVHRRPRRLVGLRGPPLLDAWRRGQLLWLLPLARRPPHRPRRLRGPPPPGGWRLRQFLLGK